MRNFRLFILIILCITLMSPTFATDSIQMEPGMWEMTSTVSMPMLPEPRVATKTECVDKSEFSVDDLMKENKGECSITESQVNGNSLTWSMRCEMQGGTGIGGGQFISNGNSGSGNMHMSMEVQGQTFKMETSWQGRRIGPC